MKIVLSAACVAACFAGAAQAQSAVTLYGRIDIGLQYSDPKAANAKATSSVVSGNSTGSRFGFQGREDLGGGLSAGFNLEGGFNADVGTSGQGALFGRQATAHLQGGFGTLAFGRAGTFGSGTGTFDMIGDIGVFGTGWSDLALFSTGRVNNAVFYLTPKMGGVQAGVVHSFSVSASESAGRETNIHLTGLGLSYGGGPIYAALAYETINNPAAGASDEKQLIAGLRWTIGSIRLHGAYMQSSDEFNSGVGSNGPDSKQFHLGAAVKVGSAGELSFAWYDLNGEARGTTENDETRIGVGYWHSLSRRTALYGAISDRNGKKSLDNSTTDRRRLNVGMVHRF
jgi:general bacterial porin, GBP family